MLAKPRALPSHNGMKFLLPALLIGSAMVLSAEEEPASSAQVAAQALVDQLLSESYRERKEALSGLTVLADEHSDTIPLFLNKLRLESDEPEVRGGVTESLRTIFRYNVLGQSSNDFGVELGWFIDHDGDNLATYPFVLKIDEGGPAALAGVKRYDVITHFDGEELRAPDARKLLLRKFRQFKGRRGATFIIKRIPGAVGNSFYHRTIRKGYRVKPIRTEAPPEDQSFDEKKFRDWLRTIKR